MTRTVIAIAVSLAVALIAIGSSAGERPAPPSEQVASRSTSAASDGADRPRIEAAALRAAKWLGSMQRSDGLFRYGFDPALDRPFRDDNAVRQAGAAAALARAAHHFRDPALDNAARRAIQAILAQKFRADNETDRLVRPRALAAEEHPIGLAALVLWAIAETANPNPELLDAEERLARFLVSRQRLDGSFILHRDPDDDDVDDARDPGICYYPGEALFALARSHAHRPAAFKLEALRKARPYYQRLWLEDPQPAFIPWQTAAWTEFYLLTRDRSSAAFVLDMNDWLLQLQYDETSGVDGDWIGGFAAYEQGSILREPPGASTGSYAESLAEAHRLARAVGDDGRATRYRRSCQRAIAFLMRNQYRAERLAHFAPAYRAKLDGAFHAGVASGAVRIDFAQHALVAMLRFVESAAETNHDQPAAIDPPVIAPTSAVDNPRLEPKPARK